jgi:hypothetical protein
MMLASLGKMFPFPGPKSRQSEFVQAAQHCFRDSVSTSAACRSRAERCCQIDSYDGTVCGSLEIGANFCFEAAFLSR